MKIILLFSILFCAIAMPALGELTDADLDKIRLIVQEEIQKELKPIKAEIGTLKTDGAVVKTEIKNLNEKIDDRFASINDKFASIEKNFDRQNNIIIACIGIPMAILAIGATVWGILANRRNPKVNEQREQIEELTLKDKKAIEQLIHDQEQKIEALTQEIETLKQQHPANP